jgi:hypothetical protein
MTIFNFFWKQTMLTLLKNMEESGFHTCWAWSSFDIIEAIFNSQVSAKVFEKCWDEINLSVFSACGGRPETIDDSIGRFFIPTLREKFNI